MREELLNGLTDEQIAKVRGCKSTEDILSLAKAEGVELSQEQLEAVSGGGCIVTSLKCPKCKSKKINYHSLQDYECKECGYRWCD